MSHIHLHNDNQIVVIIIITMFNIILLTLTGTFFSISLFSNYLKLDDTMLGIISCSSKIVAAFAYAFARNNLEIYIGEM